MTSRLRTLRILLGLSVALLMACSRARPVSVHALPDLDGDGIREVLVLDGEHGEAGVPVLSGETLRLQRRLALPPGATVAAVAHGLDVDGDGREDFALGLGPATWLGRGEVHVLAGASGTTLRVLTRNDVTGEFGRRIASIRRTGRSLTSRLFVLDSWADGDRARGYLFDLGARVVSFDRDVGKYPSIRATRLAALGDLDGDGVGELAIGWPLAELGGRVLVLSGADLDPLWEHAGRRDAHFGEVIASVPDRTGDGLDEVIVLSRPEPPRHADMELDVLDGAAGERIETHDLPGLSGVRMLVAVPGDDARSGASVLIAVDNSGAMWAVALLSGRPPEVHRLYAGDAGSGSVCELASGRDGGPVRWLQCLYPNVDPEEGKPSFRTVEWPNAARPWSGGVARSVKPDLTR